MFSKITDKYSGNTITRSPALATWTWNYNVFAWADLSCHDCTCVMCHYCLYVPAWCLQCRPIWERLVGFVAARATTFGVVGFQVRNFFGHCWLHKNQSWRKDPKLGRSAVMELLQKDAKLRQPKNLCQKLRRTSTKQRHGRHIVAQLRRLALIMCILDPTCWSS